MALQASTRTNVTDVYRAAKMLRVTEKADFTGATITSLGTVTTATFTAATITTIDINGGAIDGTPIGGTTPAAITGTTITASTQFVGPILTSGAASDVALKTSGGTQVNIAHTASVVNYWNLTGGATGSPGVVTMTAAGTDSNIDASIGGKGTGTVRISSHFARYLTVTGSAGSSVTLSASDGNLVLTSAGGGTQVQSPISILAHSTTAIPAGGTAGAGLLLSSTSNFGVFFGSGAPTLAAAKGSFYLRSDGSGTSDRAYINTDGSTTWTALTTAA